MKRMMNDNNFVRHLQACETMGGATTICCDKTGTLTQNKMTVVRFTMDGEDQGQEVRLDPAVQTVIAEAIAVNSNAYVTVKFGRTEYVGSSSECALLQLLPQWGLDYKAIRRANPIVSLREFSSDRKMMSTVIEKDGHLRSYVKGAPDFVLRGATHSMDRQGDVHELTEGGKMALLAKTAEFSDLALRTMLLCFRDMGEDDDPEQDLTVLALVGIEDPLRPEVVHCMHQCERAGVMVRMVTGDFVNTAKAIATQCGILKPDGIAMLGEEFAGMSKTDLMDILPRLQVLARSSPRDKLKFVTLLMESGEVVAVTGDGSNDSPALKKANVGLSMGLCGTELAKMASDIVILDDNFRSIMSALKWGRCVYDNVRGFLQFQVTVNFAAMLIAFIGSIALKESPLKALQLLWVNLIMDSLGALALATRGPSDALLRRPPYGESDGLFSNVILRNIVGQCTYQMAVLLLILFGAQRIFHIDASQPWIIELAHVPGGTTPDDRTKLIDEAVKKYISTFIFNTFVYMQVFNLINARAPGQDMSAFDGITKNPFFVAIFFIIAVVQALLSELARAAFRTFHMRAVHWGIAMAFSVGTLVVGFWLRLVRLPDHTVTRLNALRKARMDHMRLFYEGIPPRQQWEMSSLDADSPSVSVDSSGRDTGKGLHL
jgi:Ca2+-transporting ATPase